MNQRFLMCLCLLLGLSINAVCTTSPKTANSFPQEINIFQTKAKISGKAKKVNRKNTKSDDVSISLPPSLRSTLKAEYPKWKTARVSESAAEYFRSRSQNVPLQIVKGDFDGNGKIDYALNIISPKKGKLVQNFVVFMKTPHGFSKRVLETFPYSDKDFQTGVFLALKSKGQKGYDYEAGRNFRFKNDAVEIVFFEKASSAYIFEKGKFRSILMSD